MNVDFYHLVQLYRLMKTKHCCELHAIQRAPLGGLMIKSPVVHSRCRWTIKINPIWHVQLIFDIFRIIYCEKCFINSLFISVNCPNGDSKRHCGHLPPWTATYACHVIDMILRSTHSNVHISARYYATKKGIVQVFPTVHFSNSSFSLLPAFSLYDGITKQFFLLQVERLFTLSANVTLNTTDVNYTMASYDGASVQLPVLFSMSPEINHGQGNASTFQMLLVVYTQGKGVVQFNIKYEKVSHMYHYLYINDQTPIRFSFSSNHSKNIYQNVYKLYTDTQIFSIDVKFRYVSASGPTGLGCQFGGLVFIIGGRGWANNVIGPLCGHNKWELEQLTEHSFPLISPTLVICGYKHLSSFQFEVLFYLRKCAGLVNPCHSFTYIHSRYMFKGEIDQAIKTDLKINDEFYQDTYPSCITLTFIPHPIPISQHQTCVVRFYSVHPLSLKYKIHHPKSMVESGSNCRSKIITHRCNKGRMCQLTKDNANDPLVSHAHIIYVKQPCSWLNAWVDLFVEVTQKYTKELPETNNNDILSQLSSRQSQLFIRKPKGFFMATFLGRWGISTFDRYFDMQFNIALSCQIKMICIKAVKDALAVCLYDVLASRQSKTRWQFVCMMFLHQGSQRCPGSLFV